MVFDEEVGRHVVLGLVAGLVVLVGSAEVRWSEDASTRRMVVIVEVGEYMMVEKIYDWSITNK